MLESILLWQSYNNVIYFYKQFFLHSADIDKGIYKHFDIDKEYDETM